MGSTYPPKNLETNPSDGLDAVPSDEREIEEGRKSGLHSLAAPSSASEELFKSITGAAANDVKIVYANSGGAVVLQADIEGIAAALDFDDEGVDDDISLKLASLGGPDISEQDLLALLDEMLERGNPLHRRPKNSRG